MLRKIVYSWKGAGARNPINECHVMPGRFLKAAMGPIIKRVI
jgi:hypothetical protein